jgi:hypothetical protein
MFRADNSAYSGVLETLKGTNAHGRGRPTAPSVDRNTTMHEKGKVVFRGSQLLKPSFQVIDFKEGFGRGEWIRTTDLLVPNQGISTTYEHRSLKTQGLHAFCLDPTWTLKAKLWANWVTVGPCLDPGALQIYEVKSCGSLERSRATFPEILETSAELGTTQGDYSVGAFDFPMHAGSLEAGPDRDFASGLQDAG